MIDKTLGLRPGDAHFAHVRHVEHTHGITHGVMLLDDASILDGHVETAKRAHERAQRHMM